MLKQSGVYCHYLLLDKFDNPNISKLSFFVDIEIMKIMKVDWSDQYDRKIYNKKPSTE